MKTTTLTLAAILFLLGCNSAPQATASKECCEMPVLEAGAAPKTMATFGAPQKLTDAQAVPIAKVLESPEQYKDKYVRITGKVSQVCTKKGCWLRVAPEQTAGTTAPAGDIFIKFRDPPAGRLVPLEAVGHDVVIEGTLKVGVMPEKSARHFKEDAGASPEEIAKIVGPQPQLVLAGPAVAIEGVKNEQPSTPK